MRYEWDFDIDGFRDVCHGHRRLHPAALHPPTLRVTNEQGQQAAVAATVTVCHPVSSSVDYDQIFDNTRLHRITLRFSRAAREHSYPGMIMLGHAASANRTLEALAGAYLLIRVSS